MILVYFWMGGDRRARHMVAQKAVDDCYALPKSADRFAYWRRVTGNLLIEGHVLMWWTKGEPE